jgi:hypothetical protein
MKAMAEVIGVLSDKKNFDISTHSPLYLSNFWQLFLVVYQNQF